MADNDVMLALGDYRFSVATAAYQLLSRTTNYRWAMLATFGSIPKHQYVGPGKDTISLKGVVYPHYKGGLGQIDAMRATAGQGVPLPLRASTGKNMGKWIIVSIREMQSNLIKGNPLKQEFELSLIYYGAKK